MRGMLPSSYMDMASGSPCVSSDHSTWPSTKNSVGFFIGVDVYDSEKWAEMLYVAECHLPVQRVKSNFCMNQYRTASVSLEEKSALIP